MLTQLPTTDTEPDAIHNAALHLPSSLPLEILKRCSQRLVLMEKELRVGQCRDALAQLRTKLNARARLLKHKYVNIRGQLPNTRALGLVKDVNVKIDAAATRYRNALTMLRALDRTASGGSEWRSEFFELGPQDVRGLSTAELPDAPTQERAEQLQARRLLNGGVVPEGNRTISWIWRGSLKGSSEGQGMQDEYGEGWLSLLIHIRCSLTSYV